ncbi:MAG TPA: ATP-binding cassette domain-containing protein [Falsiroseomonas sp.]|jgi:ABC-type protease/lipase transport system fused ATPase/permease subunit|nr:ATP-binding cassette domain-containing protein [Falsiroseomonas sp.]
MQPPARPLDIARGELAAALRLALPLGAVVTVGGYLLLLLKLQVFSLVLPTGSMGTLAGIACGYLIGAAMLAALDHGREVLLLAVGNRLARTLAPTALRSAAAVRVPGTNPAALASQALGDVGELRRALGGPLAASALDALMVPLLLLLLLVMDARLAGFGLACGAVAALIGHFGERRTAGALTESNRTAAETTAMVADAMRCAEPVAAMGMLPALQRRWLDRMARSATRLRQAQSVARSAATLAVMVQTVSGGGALLLGAALVLGGAELGIGLLLAMLIMPRIAGPFARLASSLNDLAAARAAWARLAVLLAAAPPPAAGRAFPCPEGRLVLERMTVLVPKEPRPLLREVSLVAAPGDIVAIAGAVGSGKSTLLRIIAGASRPAAGAAFLDGHATWQWDREDIARHLGMLPQEPVLTEGSVAEAIARLGTPDLPAVIHAARLAGAERLIARLPYGYATRIGPDTPLSLGQRQRLALARALYGEPRLLLLDEPSAWLDSEGEATVLALLRALKARGATVLFSSHRPALLRAADRVLVLRNGTLIQAGRPQPLLAAPRRAAPAQAMATRRAA